MKTESKGFYEIARSKNASDIVVLTTGGTKSHFHHQIELLVVTEGVFKVAINGVEKIVSSGTVCISDSFDTHCYEMLEKGKGYVVIVPKNSMLSEYNTLTKNQVYEENFLFDKKAFNLIKPLVLMLEKNLPDNNRLFNKGIILAIMGIVEKNLPWKSRSESDKVYLMKDVLEYIHDNLKDELSLEGLSKRFGYTPNHFSLIFRKFTHSKLNNYLNTVRLEQATAFMMTGKNILDSAMFAGFDSMRTFYRVFNEQFGIPPSIYLKQINKKEDCQQQKTDGGN